MALSDPQGEAVVRLASFGLNTADADALAAFYEAALGCRRLSFERRPDADCLTLALGREIIVLTQFHHPGRAYPRNTSSADPIFQHFAVVVTDMAASYRRLTKIGGWSPISKGGPRRLPARFGGVTAFKFRDPEGHPLELLAFPERSVPPHWRALPGDDGCLGIDHSAIGIADSSRSIAFYENLGFRVVAKTLNHGAEQSLLDGLVAPVVEVTALAPVHSTPHIELLCYRSATSDPGHKVRHDDIAATRLFLATSDLARRPSANARGERIVQKAMLDPDGHRLLVGRANVGDLPDTN